MLPSALRTQDSVLFLSDQDRGDRVVMKLHVLRGHMKQDTR